MRHLRFFAQGVDKIIEFHHFLFVRAETADDLEALKLLVDKSCLCAVHTLASGRVKKIGTFDVALMNFVYKHKYSKQKDRERS